MKRIYLYKKIVLTFSGGIFCIFNVCFSQAKPDSSFKKNFSWGIFGGVNYYSAFNDNYIPPVPPPQKEVAHAGYFILPNYSFQGGGILLYKIHSVRKLLINFRTGIQFNQKKFFWESDQDSIKKYVPDTFVVIQKEFYTYYSLNIPIYFDFSFKGLSLFGGTRLNIFPVTFYEKEFTDGRSISHKNITPRYRYNGMMSAISFSLGLDLFLTRIKKANIFITLLSEKRIYKGYDFQMGILFKPIHI